MKLPAGLRVLIADPLFLRVCTVLWGMPFVAMGVGFAMAWHPDSRWEWLGFFVVELVCMYFAYFMCVALFGSDKRLSESSVPTDGGDLFGLVLVAVVALLALPITLIIRAVASRRH